MAWTEHGIRWFGVKVWRSWTVGDAQASHVEEAIILIRADSEQEAVARARAVARRDHKFANELGEQVYIEFRCTDLVYDTKEDRLRDGFEVFAQVYELDENGVVIGWPPSSTEHTA